MHNLFWALLILFSVAVLFRMDWVYYLVYLVGGIWAISHWWVRRSLSHLTIQRHMLTRAFPGEAVEVTIRLTNLSWLPLPWLQVQEQVPLELKEQPNYRLVMSLGSRSRGEYRYVLRCKQRGYYLVGPLLLTTGDLFGFTSASWQETHPTYVTVYPNVLTLEELGLPSRSPFGTLASRQRLFEDPARVAGVRDYATGDSLRRIHWKASAHEDTLLVKKFQPAIALNATVVLDLNRRAYDFKGASGYGEWAIVVAASLASYVIDRRQPVGLITNGLDPIGDKTAAAIPTHQGQGHLMNVLGLLARVRMHPTDPGLAAWLPRQIAGLAWGTTLLVVVPKLDEETLWVLHGARRRGSNVVVMICGPQADYRAIRAQGERLGVTIQRTLWEEDLKRFV